MAHSLTVLSFLLSFVLFHLVAVGASHAASPAEVYWKAALPNSPMPSAIRDLIYPGKAAASSSQEDSVGSVFFLEKDLHPGSTMTLHFTRATAGATLLSRSAADSLPFSSTKLPDILSRLSVPAGSPTATTIRSTLAECEAPALAGEAKLCATSLESMVDFATSRLGTRNVRAVSTSVGKEVTPKQAYTVSGVQRLPGSGNMVACHGMGYAYAAFGCHTTTAAAYTVTLAGADGTQAEALAACHVDAAPGVAEAYKKLGVAPGSVPVCHFLPQDDMLWVRN